MKWLFRELNELLGEILALLKLGETWLTLGLLVGFGILAYLVSEFAFQTDSVLLYLHLTAKSCRELSNGPIIFLFCGMIFFLLAVVVTFGEFQRYFSYRQRGAFHETRQALLHGLGWGIVAIAISCAALLFFNTYCR
jgi:hypothetical protein